MNDMSELFIMKGGRGESSYQSLWGSPPGDKLNMLNMCGHQLGGNNLIAHCTYCCHAWAACTSHGCSYSMTPSVPDFNVFGPEQTFINQIVKDPYPILHVRTQVCYGMTVHN